MINSDSQSFDSKSKHNMACTIGVFFREKLDDSLKSPYQENNLNNNRNSTIIAPLGTITMHLIETT